MAAGDAGTTPSPRLHAGWLVLTILVAAYTGTYAVVWSWRIIANHAWGSIPARLIIVVSFWWLLRGCWHGARTRGRVARASE